MGAGLEEKHGVKEDREAGTESVTGCEGQSRRPGCDIEREPRGEPGGEPGGKPKEEPGGEPGGEPEGEPGGEPKGELRGVFLGEP